MSADTRQPRSVPASDVFRSILDHAPAMIWVTAPDGRCTYLNSAWYSFTGQTEAGALGYGWLEATHPDERAAVERIFLEANAAQVPFHLEYRLRTCAGDYRWHMDAGNPRFDADGAFLGYVGSVVDIHDRKETEDRLRVLTDAVPAFVWFASSDGAVHYLNDRWYEYTGQTPTEALPNGWLAVVHPDDRAAVVAAWTDTRARGESYQIECRYRRRDGEFRWYMVRADPMRAAGAIVAWIGTCIDIHDRKVADERRSLLINELNHRVKNTLATVQALATQTLHASPDPHRFREAFEDRLVNLARAHDLLTASDWRGARLSDVVERAVAPWSMATIDARGADVWLDPQQALSISMALHELATNASKYGALAQPGGRVQIHWSREAAPAGGTVRLRWKELGGPLVEPPTRRGFGSRLLERGLSRELHGTVALSFPPDGVECVVAFPLRPVAAGEPPGELPGELPLGRTSWRLGS